MACFSIACWDQFTATVTVDSTMVPAGRHIEVQQALDGTVLLDETISPAYETSQPNGPGCGPICHYASAAWTIP